jgi:Carboxypeptidase regulatory-like domain
MVMRSRLKLVACVMVLGLAALLLWNLSSADGPGGDPRATADARSSRSDPRSASAGDAEDPPSAESDGAEDGSRAATGETDPSRALTGPGRIVGRVTGPDGEAVTGGDVLIHRTGSTSRPSALGELLITMPGVEGSKKAPEDTSVHVLKLDADGWFMLENLPAGTYRVIVRAPGFLNVSRRVPSGAGALMAELEPAHAISGTLVETGSGDPVAGASIDARPVNAPAGTTNHVGYTGPDGRFTIKGLPAGDYTLHNNGTLYETSDTAWAPSMAGPFPAGRTGIRMEATRGLVISGEIRDASGAVLKQPVDVEALGITERGDEDYSRRRRVRSTKDGRFRITGLAPGRYDLGFQPRPQSENSAAGYAPLSAMTRRGVLAGTEDLVIVMGQGMPIVGRVVDTDGKAAGAGGYLYVHPMKTISGSQASMPVLVRADGTFKTPPLDVGTLYRILASGFDGFTQCTVESVRPGEAEVVVTLTRAGRITGRVVDEAGKPARWGTPVYAYSRDVKPGSVPGTIGVAYTTAGGAFIVDGLHVHPFILRAGGAQSAYLSKKGADGLEPGATDVVLVVEAGVRLSGRLVDHLGNAVKTRYLAASQPGPERGLPASTSIGAADGSFILGGLRPGKVSLHAIVGGKTIALGEFTAPGEGIVITLPEG